MPGLVLPTVRPSFPPFDVIAEKFRHCLYQGHVTNNGQYVRRFEDKLAEYLRAPTLAFNNGQTALMAMLMAAGVGPGDGVIMPSFTFCGTPAAVAALGAIPIFVESDPDRLTIDPAAIADLMTRIAPKPKAILGVDVYGICCDYTALERLADDYQIPLLFDSAPAFGSMPTTSPTGNRGTAQIFSFHATKPFSTMEGGALSTCDPKIFERARCIRDFGQNADKDCVEVGLNGKMLEVCAIVGLEQIKNWRERRHGRTFKAAAIAPRLKRIEGVRVSYIDDGHWPIWTYYPIFIEPEFGKSRDEVYAFLRSKNIEARKYYTACHLLKPFANGQRLPISERLTSTVIALPLYDDMLDDEMNTIVDALEQAKKNA